MWASHLVNTWDFPTPAGMTTRLPAGQPGLRRGGSGACEQSLKAQPLGTSGSKGLPSDANTGCPVGDATGVVA